MQRRGWFVLGWCVIALLFAAPAIAAQGSTVTATGTGQAKVRPSNRHSNASIVAAYNAARKASIAGAIREAHEYALDYAHNAGLTLGAVMSVSDAQTNGYYGPGQFFGPFGPNQFCGTLRQPVFKRTGHRIKIVRFKKVHRCIVPADAYTTLSVTYSAS